MATAAERVFGFHPTSRGFGWVLFEGPFAPIDWGLVSAGDDKNASCLRRLERLLDRFAPETLVLEAFDRQTTRRARRIADLCTAVRRAADDRGIETAVYSRAEIREAFAEVEARTRREVAEAVARHLEAFRHRLPPPRRPWESEDARGALFAAAAVVLTHHRLGL
ncbi:MAG: hypothetical protein QME55_01235 [Brevundimonas sp.]|uniref:hypothetical protein n=1 Tax=Brevundimonas sp. TaxID=1871086 RepID=UPI0026302B9A|nr:hypothetical protein [Brevundimonas sp.]MDI6623328.1 hypothetical protein [Brevundimonas sp.]MDQ7812757.1 hypothetical protein [Brevundimonas sp.]